MKNKQIGRNIRGMLSLAWHKNRKYLLFSALQIIASSVSPFINLLYMKYLIDGIMYGKGFDYILQATLIMVAFNFIFTNLGTLANNFTKLNAKALMVPMSSMFCKKAVEMDYQFTEDTEVLEEMNRASFVLLNGDNLEVYLGAINGTIIAFIQLVVTIAIVTTMNPLIFVMVLVVSVVNTLISLFLQKKNYKLHRLMMPVERRWRYLIELAVDLQYGKTVRIYDLKDFLLGKSRENRKEYFEKNDEILANNKKGQMVMGFINVAQQLVILMWLIYAVLNRALSIGNFTVLINSAQQFSASFSAISNQLINLYQNNNYINDFFTFLQRESCLRHSALPDRHLKKEEPGIIELRHVSFHYPNSDQMILRDVNLTIAPGEHITIVGENGAGKTTLIKLIMRLYDVTEGEILYDGINIKEYDYDEYMDIFSTVFQDFKIFALSIYENITFEPDSRERKQEVDAILKDSGLYEKVQSLPLAEETVLSRQFDSEGMELSGGQHQKLVFCRAVYKNGPVVILDEPTANLSPVAEHDIYEQFNRLVHQKTAIYISHRLSSSKISDKICVLKSGSIAEYGTHNELMRLNGLYAEMFRLQSQYYEKEAL